MSEHEVISAFLDNEPFDPAALDMALATADGRGLLIDLVALRKIAQPDDALLAAAAPRSMRRTFMRLVAAAAVAATALAGGYRWGTSAVDREITPPQPTQVIKSPAAWHDISGGGR